MRQGRIPPRQSQDAVAHHFGTRPAWKLRLINRITGGAVQRDGCRTPMQWDATDNAGCSPPAETAGTAAPSAAPVAPWMPVNADYQHFNTARQFDDPTSLLHCYRRLLALRRTHSLLESGSLSLVRPDQLPRTVLGYSRWRTGGPSYLLILLNFSSRRTPDFTMDGECALLFTTHTTQERSCPPDCHAATPSGGSPLREIHLEPFEGLVIEIPENQAWTGRIETAGRTAADKAATDSAFISFSS